MFKQKKTILAVGLLLLVLAVPFAQAAQPTEELLPWRLRVLEVLEKHPEVLEELEALEQEYDDWDAAEDYPLPEAGFFGRMRGWMQNRGWLRPGPAAYGGHCYGPQRHHLRGRRF